MCNTPCKKFIKSVFKLNLISTVNNVHGGVNLLFLPYCESFTVEPTEIALSVFLWLCIFTPHRMALKSSVLQISILYEVLCRQNMSRFKIMTVLTTRHVQASEYYFYDMDMWHFVLFLIFHNRINLHAQNDFVHIKLLAVQSNPNPNTSFSFAVIILMVRCL